MMNNWFDTARLGMFIHWGHSSQQGCELSWPLFTPINETLRNNIS
ncbi:MAG: alpha-L-fucosidase [Nostoc sp.]